MDTDVLVDNELHPREPDTVIGQHRCVIGELGIDSISVNAASLLRTTTVVHEAEQAAAARSLAAQ